MDKFAKVKRILEAYREGRIDTISGSDEGCPYADGTDTAFAYMEGVIDQTAEDEGEHELDNLKERMKDVRSALDAAIKLTVEG